MLSKEGIWCGVGVLMIFWQNQRLTDLEGWVRKEVITVITANTAALTDFKTRTQKNAYKSN